VTFSGGMLSRSTPGPLPQVDAGDQLRLLVNGQVFNQLLYAFAHARILCHDATVEQLDSKVAVVTGAGSGIGRALAARFAAEGMRVIGADVEPEALARYGRRGRRSEDVHVRRVRLRRGCRAVRLRVRVVRIVDVLCNNAGVFVGGMMWERSEQDFAWVLGVNLWGILHAIRAFVPRMIAAGTPAHIVNTSSMAGLTTNAVSGPYTISKHAALAASECLAHDLAMVGAPNQGVGGRAGRGRHAHRQLAAAITPARGARRPATTPRSPIRCCPTSPANRARRPPTSRA